ncbi:MAG: LysR family transcriptional regulator [Actinomycetota bacterium]
MERRQLEYFVAVVEQGSFTSAAQRLHVAQPSLSHGVRLLERELGAQLFHRLGRGATLTPAGEALLPSARQVLRDLATASAAVASVAGLTSGQVDVVAPTALAVDPLAHIVSAFRAAYPAVNIRIVDSEQTHQIPEMVRTGSCELGLADFSVPVRGLQQLELTPQELVAVLPPGSPVPDGGGFRLTDLARFDLVATPRGTTTRGILDGVAARGTHLRVAVETPHRAAIIPMVLAGAGAALLPRSMADDAARRGAVTVTLTPRLTRRARLVWRPGPLSPGADAFVRLTGTTAARRSVGRRPA